MKKCVKRNKIFVLIIYVIAFYSIWTIWQIFGNPMLCGCFSNEYISKLISDGLVKNLIWTVPALLLINHYKDDIYAETKDLFKINSNILKYLFGIFLFTVCLCVFGYAAGDKIALKDSFTGSDLIVVLFVGITEETVFRGWLLNFTLSKKKKWLAVAVNSIMFVLIHFPVWISRGQLGEKLHGFGFLVIMALSIVYSLPLIKGKSIMPSIFMHMYWDLFVFALF